MLSYNRGDETIICPYDETHNIQKKSFQAHIIKCRKANPGKVKMVVCKFDKTHVVPKPELKHHMKDCPSRSVLDRDMQCRASTGHALTGDVRGPEIKGSHSAEIDEDWDSAPQKYRTQALFNKPDQYYSDEDDMTPYIPPGANYVGKLSPKKQSQSCHESPEQVQRKVPLTQSKAARLSESPQLRNVISNVSWENSVMRNNVQAASQPPKTAMRGGNAYVQNGVTDFPRGRSRGLIAPSSIPCQSYGRGVVKYASSLTTKSSHQPWGQSSTAAHHQLSDQNSTTQFLQAPLSSTHNTPSQSPNSSQTPLSPEAVSDVSSDYSSHHEIPTFGFTQLEEMAVQRNKILSTKQAQELEELLQQHEQERQGLLHRQEQERALLLRRQEQERALAFEPHDQLIQLLLQPLAHQQACGNVSKVPNQSLVASLELLSLDQRNNVSFQSPNNRNGPLTQLGSLSYARVVQTKSEAFSDVTSDVQSESWCEDESESDVSDRDKGSIPERMAIENMGDSQSNNKDYSKMSCMELKKQKKKMEKKLKQINSIEARRYRGETILPEEEIKLKRKISIEINLETISQHL